MPLPCKLTTTNNHKNITKRRDMQRIQSKTSILLLICTICSGLLSGSQAASRAYPQGCAGESPSYYDYDSYPLPPPHLPSRSHDDFALLRRLGAGKFSDVFEAVDVGIEKSHAEGAEGDSGQAVDPSALCVIKCLKPVSERRIKRELLVLYHASKLPNLARLRGVVLSGDDQAELPNPELFKKDASKKKAFKAHGGRMPSLVLEHAGPNSRWLCHGRGSDTSSSPPWVGNLKDVSSTEHKGEKEPLHLTEYEIKYYLCHLLVALDALHSRGIMHRDIKPRNVLINRCWPPPSSTLSLSDSDVPGASKFSSGSIKGRKIDVMAQPPLMLIDLGLADFYLPNQSYNVRVASRHYKSPELLLGYEYYDYGLDMWGVGCILGGLLLRREPFFRGKDNTDQLGKIVAVLGCQDLLEYCDKNAIQLSSDLEDVVHKYTMKSNFSGKRKSWLTLMGISKSSSLDKSNASMMHNFAIPSNEGIDLLDNLLVYDHEKRLTAREAMAHPFFDEIRELVKAEVQLHWNSEQNIM